MNSLATTAGIAAPILFLLTFTIEGLIRPGYSPASMPVSALSIGPRGWIQIANFLVSGCGILFFALTAFRQFRLAGKSRLAPILLIILAIALFLSGPFVMDPPGTARAAWTLHGWIHQILGTVVFGLMPVICLIFYLTLRSQRPARIFKVGTGAAIVLIIAAVIFMKLSQAGRPWFENNLGIFQRAALFSFMLWLAGLSSRLRRDSTRATLLLLQSVL
ncbi:MAG: DUF998 domain-containing protein [Spirochaetia bacterium]|nr:DUF998 domain-containing protein [Spirochaetia bacterium]